MKIKEAIKLAESRWLNLFDIRWVDKSGNDRSWQMVSRQSEPKYFTGQFEPGDAVVVVPYHTGYDKLVVTREFRVPLGDYEYGFPAGLIEKGESVEQATRRELTEETGLTVARFTRISPPVYTTTGISDESVVMVYVECTGEPTSRFNTRSEVIEVILVSSRDAETLCSKKDLKFDAKAWLVILNYAASGKHSL
ncbi:MAG TPA: NUDIX hydrolase [Deltaproteobacteria bacterium]|nr:NUDIX hydrolase [Deltaproteobacteria bacterium]